MYIATVPNRKSPPAILIRESYREGGKPKTRTIANITHWEPQRIEALRQLLKGTVPTGEKASFEITRSLPHGHVAAVTGTVRNEPDGSVAIEAEGPDERLDRFVEWCREGPPRANVESVANLDPLCIPRALFLEGDFTLLVS